MKLKNVSITLLFDSDGMSIELRDDDAVINFAKIKLNKKQTCQALARIGNTECEAEVFNLENVGKKREQSNLEFEMTEHDYKNREEVAASIADRVCPDGWKASHYFRSQGSFFQNKAGKLCARCQIVRWVENNS